MFSFNLILLTNLILISLNYDDICITGANYLVSNKELEENAKLSIDELRDFAEKFDKKFKMSMTEVMTILGSFIISSSYVFGTLTNKNFDKDRKTTLAINQSLGFFVPTVLGSWISSKIRPKVKAATYKFVGEQSQRIKLLAQQGKITPEFEKKALEAIAKASKGVPVFASLTVFTFIYRYFTPVAVTPIANFFGNKIAENKKELTKKDEETEVCVIGAGLFGLTTAYSMFKDFEYSVAGKTGSAQATTKEKGEIELAEQIPFFRSV